MLFVLPTAELFNEPAWTRGLLEKADVPLETLAEATLLQWAQLEGQWGQDYTPLDVPVQKFLQDILVSDFLHAEALQRLTPEEQLLVARAIRAFVRLFFEEVIALLEEMDLSSYQLQTMRVVRWLGRAMVVDIVI